LESVEVQQRIVGEQGKREAPSQAHPPPLAPTVPPHDYLCRRLSLPIRLSNGVGIYSLKKSKRASQCRTEV